MILGGAKVADKIPLIMNMLDKADEIIIGGGMAFTFNSVINNTPIGKSLFDEEGAKLVPDILAKARSKKCNIHIPHDFICSDKIDGTGEIVLRTEEEGIDDGLIGLDIGAESAKKFVEVIKKSKTIFWNGPQGMFEQPQFASGSMAILNALMEQTKTGQSVTVAGGGDTLNLINSVEGGSDNISHVSTGGGASLELVEGKELPGIMALSDISKFVK